MGRERPVWFVRGGGRERWVDGDLMTETAAFYAFLEAPVVHQDYEGLGLGKTNSKIF